MDDVAPPVQSAARVCLSFDISRAGEPSNIHVVKSSGSPSVDLSALRAVKRVSNFAPLPDDYARDTVSVLFWFDYKPKKNEQQPDKSQSGNK